MTRVVAPARHDTPAGVFETKVPSETETSAVRYTAGVEACLPSGPPSSATVLRLLMLAPASGSHCRSKPELPDRPL